MKILIVSQYFYPEQFQINDIASELVKRGNEVTVLCGMPNYPKGQFFDGYSTLAECRERSAEYEAKTGVKVVHVEQKPRGGNPLSLLMNYYSFVKASKKAVKDLPSDFDVAFGYQLSPVTSMFAAAEYKKLHYVPLLYYVLDIWPVSAASMLKSKWNPVYSLVGRWSKKIYQKADRILVTSRPFIDYLHEENRVPVEKMGYLPQHAGDGMSAVDLSSDDNGITDFMFAGNLGNGQRLDVIVNAATELGSRDDYKIHMVGDGSMRAKLEQMVKEKGLEKNFIFHGNQKREDMPDIYRKADVLLITLRGNNEVGNTMPGKLQMYMTTGKPILGAINGAAQEVIRDANCGKCVAAGDYMGLAGLMKEYIEHPEYYRNGVLGKNARDYFKKNFTLDIYMDSLCRELEDLVKTQKGLI